ncbi:24510_t:CDS:2, partial [Gigaspora rosea]
EDNAETDGITSNSDSRMLEREISTTLTEVIPTSNNRIDHDKNGSQHKTSKTIKTLQSRSNLFSPFKPPFKK